MSPRIALVTDVLIELGIPDTSGMCPSLEESRRALHRATDHVGHLDPVTAELVRLRNARTQRCHLCMNLRARSALDAGGDEDLFGKVDDFERSGLPDDQVVALRVADAYLRDPAGISDDDRAAWLAALGEQRYAEVVLRLTVWTANKVMVALGLDGDDLALRTY